MKYKIAIFSLGIAFFLSSCNDLDLSPLSEASTGSWYSTVEELEMAANEFYKRAYWEDGVRDLEQSTDNFTYRNTNRMEILDGTLTGTTWYVTTLWSNSYKCIALANTFLEKTENATGISPEKVKQFRAEAYFARACKYATLIAFFGDVVHVTNNLYIEEAMNMGRTPKAEVIPHVYEDFDRAIADLPVSYPGKEKQRFTKGAALAMKARFALHMSDWEMVAKATKECMELEEYDLHEDFAELFLSTTTTSKERILSFPRSVTYGSFMDTWTVNNSLTRNAGGYGSAAPSWDLLASFLCTDGLPIDESPLFNSKKPFENRDPRCTMTIVEFGTRHLGFDYQPHPDSLKVMNYNTGKLQTNNDTRANAQYASFNALMWKKGIDDTWLQNGKQVETTNTVMRYADVLLMYAEAKTELGQIDASVLNAVNKVRARAYDALPEETGKYPAITTTDQKELRKQIRLERRVEFANETLRYMDLVRWRLAGKLLNTKNYGILYPADELREKVTSKDLWFWPSTPQIDDDGLVDFSVMEKAGQIQGLAQRIWSERQYLWPIPTDDILVNPKLKQNDGY